MSTVPYKYDIEDAMASFTSYHIPELREFLSRSNLTVGGNKDNLEVRIRGHLKDGSVPLERAFDYIDEIGETGEQHIFLFRIKQKRRRYLKELQNWNTIIKRLDHQIDESQLMNDRQEVEQGLYKPENRECLFFLNPTTEESPFLAAVYRRREPRKALFFKWVETRRWTKEEHKEDGSVEVKQLSGRSVNFLCLDLSTGDAEIRIQKLNANPEKSLREILELYRKLAEKVIEFKDFIPLLIEPAIRRLLSSRRAYVVRWEVQWIDVGNLGGGVDPGFVRGVLKRFGNYTAVCLSADWLFEQQTSDIRKIRANMDGRTNQVELPNRCLPEEIDVILSDIRKAPTSKLRNPQLDSIAQDNEKWRPILQQIDSELSMEGKEQIELEKVADKVWFSKQESIKTGEELAKRHPGIFQILYFVSCPDTDKPVSNKDGPLYFQQKKDIQAEIPCLHARGHGVAMHKTEGRVKTLLLSQKEAQDITILPRIAKAIEPKIKESHISNFMRALSFILFAILYVPLVWGTAWLFLLLQEKFTGGTMIIYMTFLPVLVLEAGIVTSLLGKPLTDRARDLLLSLASIFEKKSADGGFKFLDTDIHEFSKVSKSRTKSSS